MEKWLKEVSESLQAAIEKAAAGGIPLQNIYMLAPLLYSEAHNMKNDELFQQMIEETDAQVAADASHDEHSRAQYKFHYVSSYLFCFVIVGKVEEMQYDRIMAYVTEKMDLFEEGYGYK